MLMQLEVADRRFREIYRETERPVLVEAEGFAELGGWVVDPQFMDLMGSPYLLVAFFPSLIRMLPKPGAWMETFKHIMGFILLGTVVWIFSFLESSYVVPALGLLFTLWASCWWVGRVPLTAELVICLALRAAATMISVSKS